MLFRSAQALPEMKQVEFKRLSPVWFDVDDVAVEIHESKKNGKLLGKVIFRYWEGKYKSANVYLWLCFADYYSGFAVQAAREKWEMISEDEFPATVDEFMEKEIISPSKILLDCNDKYPEILDFQYQYESFETFCESQEPVTHTDYDNYDDEIPF